jgi:hypothetical protein
MDYTVIQEQIDRLSDAMIAKGLRNPLLATMKTLSENALTDQRAA